MKYSLKYNDKLASSVNELEEASFQLTDCVNDVKGTLQQNADTIDSLQLRVQRIAEQLGVNLPEDDIQSPNGGVIDIVSFSSTDSGSSKLRSLDSLSSTDVVVSCIAGGLGILVDFLIVRIPKNTNIIRDHKVISQHGSPLTGLLRSIGFTEEGKTSKWVKVLEKFFKVNYDTAIIPGEKGFTPRTHRLYCLAHDPSPIGFLWALKDAICGTMSYIDKSGYLKFIPTKSMSLFKIAGIPIIWMGHIVSDIFTKAGIPIPGSCLLHALQFGSIGEKGRTIGQVIEYMYLEGYDLRHLVTMSSVNAVIELVIRIYHILTKERIVQFGRPVALVQADEEMLRIRLEKMRLCGYSVAVAGNISKLIAYNLNPLSLNLPVWIAFLRGAINECERRNSTTKDVIDVVKQRADIEANFQMLEQKIAQL
ncbi:MAG: hypothetical protein HDS17_05840 [Bacteroides sp.]|nr:hypothetical protein [Bacteroides sp.]